METLAKRLATYCHAFSYDRLPNEVIHEAKRRLIDTLGCAAGAYGCLPGEIARKVAVSVRGRWRATMVGSGQTTSPDLAAFADGTLVRYLDFNDTYLSREPAHPSDNIPAAWAVAAAEGRTGKDLLAAIVLGYEIQCRFCDAASLRVRGWDHVTYGPLSTALLSGWLMRLSRDQLAHALSLAAVSNNALRQTRTGEISLWKASAFANAARNGIFAAFLARAGMTGPALIFEGEKGFFNAVSGPLSLALMGGEEATPFRILDCMIKHYPVEYHAQSAVEAALSLYPEVHREGRASDVVKSIEVRTSAVSREIIGRDPEKWSPKTRETADHSLPYCVSAALQFGVVGLAQFDETYLRDKDLGKLVKKTTVVEDPELTALYPAAVGNQILVSTPSGKYSKRIEYPKGHPKNPLTDREVEEKFGTLCEEAIPTRRVNRILESIWNLEKIDVIGRWMSQLGEWSA